MSNEETVSLDQWRELYAQAVQFKKLACWDWMYDADVFGISDPATGETAYCSVLGNLGEVFALNIYPGSEGLASFRYLYEHGDRMAELDPAESQEVFTSQLCLSISYEDRSELDKRDLESIRALGLKFRGKKAWPMFRSYRPGYLPWFISAPEARFIPTALQQAMEVARRARRNPSLFEPREDEKYLVRTLREGEWVDTWQEPAPLDERRLSPVINELQVAQLKRQNRAQRGTWEFACVPLPMVVEEGDRPFYPYGIAVMDEAGMVIGFEAVAPGTLEKEVPRVLIAALQSAEALPATLQVRDERASDLIGPIATQLNLEVQRVQTLEAINSLLSHMDDFDHSAEALVDLKTLQNTHPWEWPGDAGELFLQVLRNDRADETDRVIAAELAGDLIVMNDDLAAALLSIVKSGGESEDLRCSAAIALGPVLEQADTEGFDDPDPDEVPISEQTFQTIRESLHKLYMDASVAKHVRRRILEAAVRSPQEWHRDAIRAAYISDDEDWRLTAVFGMQHVEGFDDQILEALGDPNPEIHYEAICAAGNREVDAAWPHVRALVTSRKTEKSLLLAAIEAVASIRPKEANILVDLAESEDEDIAETAAEAMAMAGVYSKIEDDEDLF